MIKLKRLLSEINPSMSSPVQDWLPDEVKQSFGKPVLTNNWFDELYIKLAVERGLEIKLDKTEEQFIKDLEKDTAAKKSSTSSPDPTFSGTISKKSTKKDDVDLTSLVNLAKSGQKVPGVYKKQEIPTVEDKYRKSRYANMMYYGMWVIWRDIKKPITFGKLDGSGEVVKFTGTSIDAGIVYEQTTDIKYNLIHLIDSTTKLINKKKVPVWMIVAWLRNDSLNIWNKYWSPLFKQAREWWKTRLNSKDFETKLRKIRGWDDGQFKWYKYNYLKLVETCPISAADGRFPPGKSLIPNSLGINYSPQTPSPDTDASPLKDISSNTKIYIQTKYVLNENDGWLSIGEFGFNESDVVSTTIHEIQHSLWSYQPFNPSVNWKKVFGSGVNMGTEAEKALFTNDNWWYTKNTLLKKSGMVDTEKISKRIAVLAKNYQPYGLSKSILEKYISSQGDLLLSYVKPAGNDWYDSNANEHQSRFSQFKEALGLGVLDNITVEHIVEAIKKLANGETRNPITGKFNPAVYLERVMREWAKAGMPDIQKWVDAINTNLVVKQEKDKRIQQQRNRKYGDFTQSA
jgi:hypothetical protein